MAKVIAGLQQAQESLRCRPAWRLLAAALILSLSETSDAVLNVADVPLYLSGAVKPNIMLMLDNSGSMNNIVPETPYDPSTTYLASCPSANLIPEGDEVELRISSGQPRIRHGSNEYQYGASSGRRCFASGLNYMAKLHYNVSPSGYLPAQYTGNYLNWYFDTTTDPTGCSNTWSTTTSSSAGNRKPCSKSRLMIARSAAKSLVDSLDGVRMGLSTYNTATSGDGGSLLEIVGELDAAKKTAIRGKIDALSAFGNTPLAETLSDIGRYFTTGYTGNLTLHPGHSSESTASVAAVFNNHSIRNDSDSSITNPIQYSCQKSFVVYLTDGRPQGDQSISSHLADYDGDCTGVTPACLSYDRKPDREYESAGSDYLDDVAQALYEMDLRPDLVDPRGAKNNLATYMIGFADDQAMNDPLMQNTADQGGGLFLIAGNETELGTAFQSAAQNIFASLSSAAAIATNSTRLDTETLVYQARFNSGDWSGQLLAYPLNNDGTLGTVAWDAGALIPTHDSRGIFTHNDTAGAPFSWVSLSSNQQVELNRNGSGTADSCGQERLNYLRGDQTNEGAGAFTCSSGSSISQFRARPTSVLGDIVNSDPSYVKALNFGYEQLPTAEAESYAAFRTANQSRVPVVYVGANDGMLHAFDAGSGVELFAYVPKTVIPNLSKLTDPTYNSNHRYFVDGSPYAADAYIGDDWKTVLVGTLGAGGKGVFALDVTNPASFGAPNVLWEFDENADDADNNGPDGDLGYTYGQAQIAKLNNGQWVAIFGNGYNSANDRAYLYVVNLETGALIRKIATDTSTNNGLSTPALLDTNGDRIVDYAYAADLQGHIWKFDLTHASNVNNWDVAYKQGSTPTPLITVRNASNQAQPVTAALEIGVHPEGGHMIYFGTGQYIAAGDNTNTQVQTLYGIWDDDSRITTTNRSELQEQEIIFEGQGTLGDGSTSTDNLRAVSNNTVDWETKRGWYLDLLPPGGTTQGERVVSAPILRHGRAIFTTLIPSSDPCEYGGTSWIMEADAVTGSRLTYSVFNVNKDAGPLFNEDDDIVVTINGENVPVPASGMESTVGIIKPPAVVSAGSQEHKIASGTTGSLISIVEKGGSDNPRTSWKQLQ